MGCCCRQPGGRTRDGSGLNRVQEGAVAKVLGLSWARGGEWLRERPFPNPKQALPAGLWLEPESPLP